MNEPDLPVPVLAHPRWRVRIRPLEFTPERIPTLNECVETVRKCKLSLRGWDYPNLDAAETGQGSNWIAAWCAYVEHLEYWRFYQSAQFIHLFCIREAVDSRWRPELLKVTQAHLSYRKDIDWENVPGFISVVNLIYTVTEIFEFAARLCQSGAMSGAVSIEIQMIDIQGYILTTDWHRAWMHKCQASTSTLGHSWMIDSDALVAESSRFSQDAAVWFFERFGWLSPSRDIIGADQQTLLRGL